MDNNTNNRSSEYYSDVHGIETQDSKKGPWIALLLLNAFVSIVILIFDYFAIQQSTSSGDPGQGWKVVFFLAPLGLGFAVNLIASLVGVLVIASRKR